MFKFLLKEGVVLCYQISRDDMLRVKPPRRAHLLGAGAGRLSPVDEPPAPLSRDEVLRLKPPRLFEAS